MKYYFTYLKSPEIPTNVPSKARGGTVPPRPPHQIRLWVTSDSRASIANYVELLITTTREIISYYK